MARRNCYDLAIEILDAAIGGKNKSHICHTVKISFNILDRYLPILKKRHYINDFNGIYYTSDEGIKFSKRMKELKL